MEINGAGRNLGIHKLTLKHRIRISDTITFAMMMETMTVKIIGRAHMSIKSMYI